MKLTVAVAAAVVASTQLIQAAPIPGCDNHCSYDVRRVYTPLSPLEKEQMERQRQHDHDDFLAKHGGLAASMQPKGARDATRWQTSAEKKGAAAYPVPSKMDWSKAVRTTIPSAYWLKDRVTRPHYPRHNLADDLNEYMSSHGYRT